MRKSRIVVKQILLSTDSGDGVIVARATDLASTVELPQITLKDVESGQIPVQYFSLLNLN